jgi:phage terminase large subunit-like protein
MPPRPSQTLRRKRPKTAEQTKGRRPTLAEVEPLHSTYDAPKPEGARFVKAAGDRAAKWIEANLRHFQGRWAGQPFYLLAWQRRLVRELFGWQRADGTRLYRRCYVEAPRKSGKTMLAGAIALYLAYGDSEAGPQVGFAAYDQEQAKLCYGAARHMIEANPELFEQTLIYNSALEMKLKDNPGGILRCLSRESKQQYGLNLHGLVFDELMTQKTRDMWNALTSAQGAREQPLVFAISTAGWDQLSVCFEQHELVREIHEGNAVDDVFLGVVFGAPMDADWTDERVWRRANPSLGETVTLDHYREHARRAQNQPTEQNAFRTLLLSQWVGQAERYLDMGSWDGCDPEPDRKGEAYGGLDLSATTDLTAFAVLVEGTDVYLWAFLPEEGILERERRDRVPYRLWAERGSLTLTPGPVIDYAYVKRAVLEAAAAFDLRSVEFDRWNSSQIVRELEDEGIVMVEVGQGFSSLSAPTKELQRLVVEGKLRHGGDPLLRWCASNVAVTMDAAGNVKPAKDRSAHRIDPVVALVIAIDGWQRFGNEPKRESVYAKRFRAGEEILVVAG